MRLSPLDHQKRPWRVHALAQDFELLDVWRFPLELENRISLTDFMGYMNASQRELAQGPGLAGKLFRLRAALGRLFRWDDARESDSPRLAIPGCSETSVRERLRGGEDAEALDRASRETGAVDDSLFSSVYSTNDESLGEVSNATVHALMHLGRTPIAETHWTPEMAVYVKQRGRLGRFYMRLISPFRHYIVYPAMMRAAKRGWPEYARRHVVGQQTASVPPPETS